MSEREERWKTALHEAAHVCAARALNGWNTSTDAKVSESGRGVASMPFGLTPFNSAAVSAAGIYGEKLAAIFPAPARRRRPPMPPPGFTAARIRAEAAKESAEKAAREGYARGNNDDEQIARFCISLHPESPDEWRMAFDRVHATARQAVWEHQAEIQRLALKLFHSGYVEIAGDPEQDDFFRRGCRKVNKPE